MPSNEGLNKNVPPFTKEMLETINEWCKRWKWATDNKDADARYDAVRYLLEAIIEEAEPEVGLHLILDVANTWACLAGKKHDEARKMGLLYCLTQGWHQIAVMKQSASGELEGEDN